MNSHLSAVYLSVICRIGSLEMYENGGSGGSGVICRIGSLEIKKAIDYSECGVICRIGSLEIYSLSVHLP